MGLFNDLQVPIYISGNMVLYNEVNEDHDLESEISTIMLHIQYLNHNASYSVL